MIENKVRPRTKNTAEMPSTNLPKIILRSPAISERMEDSSLLSLRNAAKFHEVLVTSTPQGVNEMHQNRIKGLRKELDYLKETEWKYHPIDKYIGQSI